MIGRERERVPAAHAEPDHANFANAFVLIRQPVSGGVEVAE